jgi:ketosteroid isomerase-like protein
MKTSATFLSTAIALIVITLIVGCNSKKQPVGGLTLMETDRYYSAMSAKEGMNAAFLAMFDSAGVMLNANHWPIVGYDSIRASLLAESDTAFTLTWEPLFEKMAASGDLGYTYGTYQLKSRASDSLMGVGKYATIWTKQADGKWKAILDTGNPGLGEKK